MLDVETNKQKLVRTTHLLYPRGDVEVAISEMLLDVVDVHTGECQPLKREKSSNLMTV